ncbi:transcription elongation factor TFIIS-like [Mercurialis annua]|uniref:transcription elongation factor TFIIS-like n=1 Tax=Mercurialis annua TaxID=3986 RepID=UPI00215FAB04|nr:transcription elongation factor TFIIS-like [Mercurialis annua]
MNRLTWKNLKKLQTLLTLLYKYNSVSTLKDIHHAKIKNQRMVYIERSTEKDLIDLFEVALFASKGAEKRDERRCRRALTRIKEYPHHHISAQFLLRNKIATGIISMRSHPCHKIQRLSRQIVSMWKTKFSHEPTPTAEKPSKFQNSETSKKVPACNSSARDNLKKEILKGLCMVLQETNNSTTRDPVRVAASLESELFLKWGVLSNGNRDKYKSVLSKLKDPKNSDFRTRIMIGEISPERVVFLSTLEIASDLTKARHRAQELKKDHLFQFNF